MAKYCFTKYQYIKRQTILRKITSTRLDNVQVKHKNYIHHIYYYMYHHLLPANPLIINLTNFLWYYQLCVSEQVKTKKNYINLFGIQYN